MEPIPINKRDVLQVLKSYLDRNEPKIKEVFLQHMEQGTRSNYTMGRIEECRPRDY